MAQQQAIHKFVLGSKEIEGKTLEFLYDKGWYSITDIVGEERNVIYKSRNAQEAYMKWNVYIGRKKERPASQEHHRHESGEQGKRNDTGTRTQQDRRDGREEKDARENRESNGRRRNRDYRRDNRRQ